ncbi:MAG: hypothetical protein HYW85_00990 [Deltaproteobacteria bacterium]|nr:hypothetical protein [Deltaproteobacteria bacterium]
MKNNNNNGKNEYVTKGYLEECLENKNYVTKDYLDQKYVIKSDIVIIKSDIVEMKIDISDLKKDMKDVKKTVHKHDVQITALRDWTRVNQ